MNSGAISAKAILLSLGTLAISALTSVAQSVPNPVANDIFLGFRVQGQPDGYLTRLGNYTTFRDTAEGTTITVSVTGIGADLSGKYGSDWSNNPNARWGIFGSSFAGQGPLLFASRERTATSVPTSPWPTMNVNFRNLAGGNIDAVLLQVDGYRGRTATANNPVGTFQPPPTPGSDKFASNYIHQTSPSVDFGVESGWNIEGDFADGPNSTVLDLYRVGELSTLRIGYFTISSSGTVTFTRQSTVTPPAEDIDTDGDGILDSLEDLAGTSKTDPTDFFRVQGTTLVGNHPAFAFRPAANRTYKLFYSETLAAGSWQEITSATPAPPVSIARYVSNGTPPTSFSFSDQDPDRRAKNKGFYRIEVSRNP